MHTDDQQAAGPIGTLEFDASTARLRADADTFFALVDHVGRSGDAVAEVPFAASGVAVEGRAHPSVRAGLGTVEEPCARLEVEVATPEGTRLHEGWLDRVSALLLDRGDGTHDFLEVDAEFLAVTLVRLTDLQSRPRLEGRGGRVHADVLDALLSCDPLTREDAAEELAGAASAWPVVAASLRTGRWQVCGIDVAQAVGPTTVTRRVAWLDTPAGVLRIDADAEGQFLAGASAGQVWRSIVGALPTDVGLGLLPRIA
ncbi:hypothetical protein [Intrasporangium flavum]|uniref:hypothetical protein n=1 Tax=Intrasporangium flavum TaxID=1428657 RepID=UPI00096BE802|nr:hypothetical protein [Intrasporangium flavum]